VIRPCLIRSVAGGEVRALRLGHPLLDDYLEFVGARARPNTWLAAAYDLKVFFSVIAKEPTAVTTADVFAFIKNQRAPRRGPRVVRLEDGEAGLSVRTIKRRLATVSGLFDYLVARGDAGVRANPVPRGMAARRAGTGSPRRGTPLLRAPRTLPRVLLPAEVDALMSVLRTHRDRAMVEAMLLGGLRRCEVLGLRLGDVKVGERRLFIAEGKGGHQRIVPISPRFFATLARYLDSERPTDSKSDHVFVVLKGPNRGHPLTSPGIDEIVRGARRRAQLDHLTCHQLRHTCLTRLREAGMALEAVQAQAGHRSIESTRVYLHLSAGWLATEYTNALAAIDAQAAAAPSAAVSPAAVSPAAVSPAAAPPAAAAPFARTR
jgi:integrase/recombinase XerD